MEKILKEIKINLKGLNKDELDDILAYYEELINDRLDSGESLKEIEESLNYKEIRSEFLPKSLNKRENIKIKESIGSSNRLLIFLLTRGKNNPLKSTIKWYHGFGISTWLSMTPALLSLVLGFFLSNFAMMIYILTFGIRCMWLSMKNLRPQYEQK